MDGEATQVQCYLRVIGTEDGPFVALDDVLRVGVEVGVHGLYSALIRAHLDCLAQWSAVRAAGEEGVVIQCTFER